MRLTRLAAAAAVLALPPAAVAQEKIDNPEFASWSKFKKGTSVTIKSLSTFGDTKSEVLVTSTLVDVGADKLVVEMSSVVKANGMEFKTPGMKRDVTKTIELPKGAKKEDFTRGKPMGTTEEGTETVKVAGTEVKAKWYKYKVEIDGTKTEAKMWVSDDVPGMMVKNEMTTTGKINSTMKMEVVEFKKP